MSIPPPNLQHSGSQLTPGEQTVISVFIQLAQAMGMQRSLGEIYGLLYATPEPLPFQDIVDRLGLSKGSVSQGLRFLRTVGAVKPVVVTGDRRDFFEPVLELRTLVGGFLHERLNPELESWGIRAKSLKISDFTRYTGNDVPKSDSGLSTSGRELQSSEGLDGSSKITTQRSKLIQARIDKLNAWHKKASFVLPMISKLLG